jgi:hypothetical protein
VTAFGPNLLAPALPLATGIERVAACGAGREPCKTSWLPMQNRVGCADPEPPLVGSEGSSSAIGMSPRRIARS